MNRVHKYFLIFLLIYYMYNKYLVKNIEEKNNLNNYIHYCFNGSTFETYDYNTLTNKQKSILMHKYPNSSPNEYSCLQGCPGLCKESQIRNCLNE